MEIRTHAEDDGLGRPHDAAVVVTSVLRPTLIEAARSVYGQDLGGRVHLLIGIDARRGPDTVLDRVLAEWDPLESTCRHASLSIL